MLTPADIELLKSVFPTKAEIKTRFDALERRMDRFEQPLEMIKDHLFNLDDEFFIHSKRIRRLEENLKILPSS